MDGMPDFSSMSNEELEKLAGGSSAAPAQAPDMSKMTTGELQQAAQAGLPLSNVKDESTESGLLKGAGTAVIKGLSSIPAFYSNTQNMIDYVLARAQGAITGEKAEDILARTAQQEADWTKESKLHALTQAISPGNVLPTQEQIQRPILSRTGEYVPESGLGRVGMAGVEAATGMIGPGLISAGGKARGILEAVKDTIKLAPGAFTAGAAGETATEVTGDPLAGIVAGIAVPTVLGKVTAPAFNKAGQYIAPMIPSKQAGIAAENLANIVQTPEETAALALAAPKLVTGEDMSLGQLTGNVGALQAEKTFRNINPQFAQMMAEKEGAQNVARIESLTNMAPEGDVLKPSEVLGNHAAAVDAAEQAIIKNLQDNSDAIHANMPEGTNPEETGNALRTMMQKVADEAANTRSKLYQSVDPDNKLSVVAKNTNAAAKDIRSNLNPDYEDISPLVESTLQKMENVPDVDKFNNLVTLDKTITQNRAMARRSGDWNAHRLLGDMKDAVIKDINEAVDNQHEFEQAAVGEGRLDPANTIDNRLKQFGSDVAGTAPPTSSQGAVRTGTEGPTGLPTPGVAQRETSERLSGVEGDQGVSGLQQAPTNFLGDLNDYQIHYPNGSLRARYELADADNLITSHDKDFRENPKFPQELQSKNRSSAPSQDQINTIANDIKPDWLGPSKVSSFGAPIVGPDNVVESGNGRTLGVSKAYDIGKADEYRNWLESNGFDTTGMKKPILIARRTSEMTPRERSIFAEGSNAPMGLRMNAAEQADSDAKFMGDMQNSLKPGDVTSAENRPFVREFLNRLPKNERGNIIDPDGAVTLDGERRILAAAARRAYGDNDLIERGFVSKDNNVKNITGALSDVAGPWHEMRAAVARGEIPPESDITKQVLDTAKLVMRARDEGRPIEDLFRQIDMFGDPIAASVRDIFAPTGTKVSGRAAIAERLQKYAEEAMKNKAEGGLFGEPLKPQDILSSTVGKVAEENPQMAAEAAAAEAEGKPAPKAKPLLQPNFDEAAANRLSEAKKAHQDYATSFRQGPVASILKDTGFKGQYRVADPNVPSKAFPAGDAGYTTVKSFIDSARKGEVDQSAGVVSAMKDIAVSRLREMMKDSPVVTPKILQSWKQKYGNALRALDEASPGFTFQFDNMAKATDLVNVAQARYANAVKGAQKGVAARLINANTPDEVRSIVGNMIKASDGPTQITNLIRQIKSDPSLPFDSALAGLRRAGVEYLMNELSNVGTAGGERVLSGAKLTNFMKTNGDAIRALYGDEGYANMDRLLADVKRSQEAIDATKAKFGSDTAQNLAMMEKALGKSKHGSILSVGLLAGLEGLHSLGFSGLKSAGIAIGSAIGKAALDKLRANGISNINDMIMEGLLDPKVGASMLQRALDNRQNANLAALMRTQQLIGRNVIASSQLQDRESEKIRDLQEKKRLGRASGGRIPHEKIADRLVNMADAAKKTENQTTEQFLDQPDDFIAHALNVAQSAL